MNIWETGKHALDRLLGLHVGASDLEFSHMAWRTLIVFCFAIILSRVADRRFLGRSASYDFMLGVILGSVLSRGINGQAQFFPTLGASLLLVLLHRAVGTLAFHSHHFSRLVKGSERVLIREGQIIEKELSRSHITYDDLCENIRLQTQSSEIVDIAEARLERNGSISVVKAKKS